MRLNDTTAPTLTSASVGRSGGSTTLRFSEDLDLMVGEALSAAARGAFSRTVDGVAQDIDDIRRDFLTASALVVYHSTIYSGQTVVVSYDQSAAGTDAIADAAGNEVADFTTGSGGVPAATNSSTQAAPVSMDATLSGLTVTGGGSDLVTFVSSTTTYTAMVASTVAEVTVTPTLNDSGASIEYLDGDDATLTDAGTADGHQVAVAEGDNVIKVKVTAADGNTTETYAVTVTRRATATNSAPTFTDGASTSRDFNETIGDAAVLTALGIGTAVEATDTDAGDTLEYSLEGTDADKFGIIMASGQLQTKPGERYNYEADSSYSVTVKVEDGSGGSGTIAVTLNVTDQDEAPVAPAVPSVTSTSGSTTSVNVMWSAPSNTGRPAITSYDLQYREGMTGNWMDGPQDVNVTNSPIMGLKEEHGVPSAGAGDKR